MVVLGGGSVSYERGTPVEGWEEDRTPARQVLDVAVPAVLPSGHRARSLARDPGPLGIAPLGRHVPASLFIVRNVNRFRGGLVFKAHGLLYHSTLGLRVIMKKKKVQGAECGVQGVGFRVQGSGCRV